MTLSAKYVTYYIDEEMRQELAVDGERKNHLCHGFPMTFAIEFVRDNGVPKEDAIDARRGYCCVSERPDKYSGGLYQIPPEIKPTVSNDLTVLYRMINQQPVGANVHYFYPEFDNIGDVSNIYIYPFFLILKLLNISICLTGHIT